MHPRFKGNAPQDLQQQKVAPTAGSIATAFESTPGNQRSPPP